MLAPVTALVLRRWLIVITLAVVSTVVTVASRPLLEWVGGLVAGYTGGASFALVSIVDGILIAFLVEPLRRLAGLHLAATRYLLRYPPTWVAAVLTIGFLATSPIEVRGLSWTSLSGSVSALSIGFVANAAIAEALSRTSQTSQAKRERRGRAGAAATLPTRRSSQETTIDVERWTSAESPIDRQEEDLLGFEAAATRVAARLSEMKRVAILGAFGSGKSSICSLAERIVRANGRMWTTTVEGWGVEPTNAADVVLRAVIAEVGRHTDVLAVASIPGRYRAALTGSKSPSAAVIGELTATPAVDALETLDDLLVATGRRLVVFLEDLDRSAGAGALTAVAALLDRLRQLDAVTFALTIDPRHAASVDVVRLCDHIEPMSQLGELDVWRILDAVLQRCRTKHDDRRIAGAEDRWKDWLLPSAVETLAADPLTVLFGGSPSPADEVKAIARLLRWPRHLKHVVRHAMNAWDDLHGEADLLELVVVETLRVGAPGGFELVVTDLSAIRSIGVRDPWDYGRADFEAWADATRKAYHDRLQTLAGRDGFDLEAAHKLLTFIFPNWKHNFQIQRFEDLQLIRCKGNADYWSRIVTRDATSATPDQKALRLIDDWVERRDTTLAAWILGDAAAAERFEHFAAQMPIGDRLALAGELHARIHKRLGTNADIGRVLGGLCVRRALGQSSVRSTFLRSELRRFLPININLAISIAHHWSHPSGRRGEGPANWKTYQLLAGVARRHLTSAAALIEACPTAVEDRELQFWLYQLIRAGHLKLKLPEKTIARWAWIAPLLRDMLAIAPDRALMPILHLIERDTDNDSRKPSMVLDSEFLKAWSLPPSVQHDILVAVRAAATQTQIATPSRYPEYADLIESLPT